MSWPLLAARLLVAARLSAQPALLAYVGAGGLAGVAIVGGLLATPAGQSVQEALAPAGRLVEEQVQRPLVSLVEPRSLRPVEPIAPGVPVFVAPVAGSPHLSEAPEQPAPVQINFVSAAPSPGGTLPPPIPPAVVVEQSPLPRLEPGPTPAPPSVAPLAPVEPGAASPEASPVPTRPTPPVRVEGAVQWESASLRSPSSPRTVVQLQPTPPLPEVRPADALQHAAGGPSQSLEVPAQDELMPAPTSASSPSPSRTVVALSGTPTPTGTPEEKPNRDDDHGRKAGAKDDRKEGDQAKDRRESDQQRDRQPTVQPTRTPQPDQKGASPSTRVQSGEKQPPVARSTSDPTSSSDQKSSSNQQALSTAQKGPADQKSSSTDRKSGSGQPPARNDAHPTDTHGSQAADRGRGHGN